MTGPEPSRGETDDVLRIGPEEPVFYIGPDTRPPVPRQTVHERVRANWEALRRPATYRRAACRNRQAPAAGQAPCRVQAFLGGRRPVPPPPPIPKPWRVAEASPPSPPEAPALPSGRVRLAELAGSMVWAAPVVALLMFPAAALLGIKIDANPEQIAYLYGLSLLGTWAAMVLAKLYENRPLDISARRLLALVAGLIVGSLAVVLARLLQLGLPLRHEYFASPQDLEPLYFGAVYAASAGWYGLAARDRRRRFCLMPLAWAALLATVLVPLWPYQRLDGVAIAAIIAATLQVVSPRSEQASRHAIYAREIEKRNRRIKTA